MDASTGSHISTTVTFSQDRSWYGGTPSCKGAGAYTLTVNISARWHYPHLTVEATWEHSGLGIKTYRRSRSCVLSETPIRITVEQRCPAVVAYVDGVSRSAAYSEAT